MENPRNVHEIFSELEALAPEPAAYLRLFVEEMGVFEIEEYKSDPEETLYSLPNLEEDQNEIMGAFDDAISSGVPSDEIREAAQRLYETLTEKPVTLWAISPILRHMGVPFSEKEDEDMNQRQPIRFHMPNLQYSRREFTPFFLACGLKEDKRAGKGSHSKWLDERGKPVASISGSKLLWLKNVIKEMLLGGFPVERIERACASLKIDFKVITK